MTPAHDSHDEQPDLEGCPECRAEFEAAYREHAWMAGAVRRERESDEIARELLDMPNADERELAEAIQWRLK